MTNLPQPLDLTVNGYAKKFCRKRTNHWYMEQITEQLDDGKQIEEVDVKLQLTRLKPLHAEWLVELFNHMTTSQGKEIIMSGWKASGIITMSGWKASGIIEAIKKRIDPFNDLDPLLTESPNNVECCDISELDEDQILAFATRDEENESDDEEGDLYYPPDSDGNIFDIFDNDEAL